MLIILLILASANVKYHAPHLITTHIIESRLAKQKCALRLSNWRRLYWYNESYKENLRIVNYDQLDFVYELAKHGNGRVILSDHAVVEPADGSNPTVSGSFIISSNRIQNLLCPSARVGAH